MRSRQRGTFSGKHTASVAVALATLLWMTGPVLARANGETVASKAAPNYPFAIVGQPLAAALGTWSATTGIRILSMPASVAKATSVTAQGQLNAAAALDALLQGTGLGFRFVDAGSVLIEAAPAASGDRMLGAVRIEGAADSAPGGINGSTDSTATEGSGSYAADKTMVATKLPISLKETPQSVSVITSQQIQDFHIADFTQAMAQAPGVSTVYGNSAASSAGTNPLTPSFYSRGFQITRLQIDGGAPLAIGNDANDLVPQINMAAYDHVEILRGADGLYNGEGDPGGAIDLTRKRPLDHQQLVLSQDIGSWNNFNTTLDGSSPLGFDGKLRGRLVLNRQSNDYFYDTANNRQTLLYGTVEALLTPSTTVAAGINDQHQHARPFYNGLTTEIEGNEVVDPHLPRSTCLCFDWNRLTYDTREVFGRIEQSFGSHWGLKLNAGRTQQKNDFSYGAVGGVLGSADPIEQPQLRDSYGHNVSTQRNADAKLNGSFELFGNEQSVLVGANYFDYDGGGQKQYAPFYRFGGPLVDIFDFNQADYAEPDHSGLASFYADVNKSATTTAYATVRLTPWAPLHLSIGMRYNRVSTRVKTHQICRNDFGCFTSDGDMVENGVRFDDSSLSSETKKFFPRGYLAASYDISPTLTAYASRTAIYIDNSLDASATGRPLAPTTGNNNELGLKFAALDHGLSASVAGFYIKQKGFPYQTGYFGVPNVDQSTGKFPDGRYCCFISDPDNKNVSKGIDLDLTGRITRGLQLIVSYVYNKTQVTPTKPLPGSPLLPLQSAAPRSIYKVWTRYDFDQGSALRGLYMGGGINGQSSAYSSGYVCTTYDFDFCSDSTRFKSKLHAYVVLSALAGYAFADHYAVTLAIGNLTDRRYYVSTGLLDGGNTYGMPRNYTLSFRASF